MYICLILLYVNSRFQRFLALHPAMTACHGLAMELAPPAGLAAHRVGGRSVPAWRPPGWTMLRTIHFFRRVCRLAVHRQQFDNRVAFVLATCLEELVFAAVVEQPFPIRLDRRRLSAILRLSHLPYLFFRGSDPATTELVFAAVMEQPFSMEQCDD